MFNPRNPKVGDTVCFYDKYPEQVTRANVGKIIYVSPKGDYHKITGYFVTIQTLDGKRVTIWAKWCKCLISLLGKAEKALKKKQKMVANLHAIVNKIEKS